LVPEGYHYFSLNIVDRSWHEILTPRQFPLNPKVLDETILSCISMEGMDLNSDSNFHFMDLFVADRKDVDVIPCKNQYILYMKNIRLFFIIKYNYVINLGNNFKSLEKYVVTISAYYGNLYMLDYFHEIGYPWNEVCCENASLNGQLECLKYLHEKGCPWNEKCCEKASEDGELECLKYLHENGCPWNEKSCDKASEGGELECLKYLHENGCPWNKKSCE